MGENIFCPLTELCKQYQRACSAKRFALYKEFLAGCVVEEDRRAIRGEIYSCKAKNKDKNYRCIITEFANKFAGGLDNISYHIAEHYDRRRQGLEREKRF